MMKKTAQILIAALSLALFVVAYRDHRDLAQLRAKYDGAVSMSVVQVQDGAGHKIGAALVPQRAGDFFVSPGAATPFKVADTGGVTRDTFDTAHGVLIAGKGGTDAYSALGPLTGFESSDTALWLLQNAIARSASNYALEANSTSLFINAVSGAGAINFLLGNSTTGALNGNALFLGGAASAAAPIFLQYTTPTTPLIESGSSATSFTIGTTNASGVLAFQGNNAVTYLSLGGATGQGEILTAAAPSIATTGNTTLTAAQAANPIIKLGTVGLTGNATVTFPNAQGFWIVDASGITLNAHTLQFVSGSTTAAAVTPSTTSQLFFVSTYGSNTISIK